MTAHHERAIPRPDAADAVTVPRADGLLERLGRPSVRTLLLGVAGSVAMLVGGFGSGGTLLRDPVLGNSALSFWRYGHGQQLAGMLIYAGLIVMVWAWVRLGRDVLARRVTGRGVLVTSVAWIVPLLISPPLFTRDPYSYLAQGALPLAGFDPYAVGPDAMGGVFTDNVHFFWQDTPAPYGPLFILLAKGIVSVVGTNVIAGVLAMRALLLVGLVLLLVALPPLTRRLGGRPEVALWIAVANPVMVVHMIGGGHNDLLVVGMLPCAALLALRGRHLSAVTVATLAMAVKASAGIALPFLVLVWAATLTGPFWKRLLRAAVPSIATFGVVFAACSVAAGVGLGWLPALSAPSMIVNWLSAPTAVGQLVHTISQMFGDLPEKPFVDVARMLSGALLVALLVRYWWRSRDGGPTAVRNAGIVLALAAILSPATLPWYLSWGFCLLAMTAWSARGLQWTIVGSVWLMVVYYPTGETALYNWGFLAVALAGAVLAAVSLLRPDPLRLRTRRTAAADVVEPPLVPPDPSELVPADALEPVIDGAARRPS
ncbi:polyprenol phosphomannose-dependent alpha 1,6 mannosyltransferase MptB [Pseudonocardia endophytica]|uniref:Alpha-1,6-mannosyltransferase n=1 Tax=Pseudonocardia endophytica TaxID=401976 RepID=A0A4R1HR52_PSEEN|nr:polyprenol phosphomannose-dependent alpha 1,6 mannosyltransferase MptB [Pseudonocardia endophytica]TCK25057.1 alpha-1,6-mannosyltransferase [Pseudonocardia endophytica]